MRQLPYFYRKKNNSKLINGKWSWHLKLGSHFFPLFLLIFCSRQIFLLNSNIVAMRHLHALQRRRQTLMSLLWRCNSRHKFSSLLLARTALPCSPCSWSFSFMICASGRKWEHSEMSLESVSYHRQTLLALLELLLQDAVVFEQVGVLLAQRRQLLLRRFQTSQSLQHRLCNEQSKRFTPQC